MRCISGVYLYSGQAWLAPSEKKAGEKINWSAL